MTRLFLSKRFGIRDFISEYVRSRYSLDRQHIISPRTHLAGLRKKVAMRRQHDSEVSQGLFLAKDIAETVVAMR